VQHTPTRTRSNASPRPRSAELGIDDVRWDPAREAYQYLYSEGGDAGGTAVLMHPTTFEQREVGRCTLCILLTHTSSSSDWLKDLSANEKAE
jgi:hypothetical protein